MGKTLSIGIGVAMILGIGTLTYLQVRSVSDFDGSAESDGRYTAAEVAEHADDASCWTIINNAVYDLTAWIGEHPGGTRAILQLCGIDGSEKYNNQHGGKEPMESILAGYKIGELTE